MGGVARRPTDSSIANSRDDAFNICHHIVIGNSQYEEAELRQDIVTQPVLGLIMGITIDFDYQGSRWAHEISYIGPDHFLPTEFQAIDLVIRQISP